MNSKLFFRHIKQNILKYTVAFSAVVHLFGIFLFPSWGIVPDLVKEKIIKINTVVKKIEEPVHKKLSEPDKKIKREISKLTKEFKSTIPKIRKKTPMVKSAKAVAPSQATKSAPKPFHYAKQLFKPVKAIQQDSSIPRPVTSFQKMTATEFPSAQFNQGPAKQVTVPSEISTPTPGIQRKHLTQVSWIDKPRTPSRTFPDSPGELSSFKTISTKILAGTRVEENFSIPSKALEANEEVENRIIKPTSLVRSQSIRHLNPDTFQAPTERNDFASMAITAPATEVQVRAPQSFDSKILTAARRANSITEKESALLSNKTGYRQMASIPSGFIEEAINGTDEANEISADQMGEIKMAFSSQVRTKIEKTKYYPRTARRRGFEGRPVVAFTLGNRGDLLEISIKSPSQHKLLNEAALDAVRSARPYPPIPLQLKVKTLRFNLPLSFILEEP